MIWSKARFQHAFELLPRVLKEVAPLLFPISLLLWSLEFYVSWLNKARFDNPYDSSMMLIVVVGLAGIILQSFASVIWVLFVAQSTHRQMKNGQGESAWSFLKKHFHQTFIEYIRAFISTGIYTLFLILPGLFRWVRLSFVCLVSAFDPEYQKGNKGALEESSRLVGAAWIPIFLLLALQMVVPTVLEESAKSGGFGLAPTAIIYLFSWIIGLYLNIYFALTFFARWSLKLEKSR